MVFIHTRALKHIYDRHIFEKKNPEDFSTILNNITQLLRHPDRLYGNKPGKRGDILFEKSIDGKNYLCVAEIVMEESHESLEIVSAYRSGNEYFEKFDLLWSGRTANPPS